MPTKKKNNQIEQQNGGVHKWLKDVFSRARYLFVYQIYQTIEAILDSFFVLNFFDVIQSSSENQLVPSRQIRINVGNVRNDYHKLCSNVL
jgi:hypothetical protein